MQRESSNQEPTTPKTNPNLPSKHHERSGILKGFFNPFQFLVNNSLFNFYQIGAITITCRTISKERTQTLVQEVITDMFSSTSHFLLSLGALRGSLGGSCNPEAEIERMKLAFESWKSMREQRAATVIQAKFKAFYTRKKFILIIHNRYILQVLHPTVVIQAAWKRYRVICMIKLRVFSKLITNYYSTNATKIARWYKSILCLISREKYAE